MIPCSDPEWNERARSASPAQLSHILQTFEAKRVTRSRTDLLNTLRKNFAETEGRGLTGRWREIREQQYVNRAMETVRWVTLEVGKIFEALPGCVMSD